MVRATDNGERIPLTLVDSDVARGTITLIVQAVGKTTKYILDLYAGDPIQWGRFIFEARHIVFSC